MPLGQNDIGNNDIDNNLPRHRYDKEQRQKKKPVQMQRQK